MSRVFANQNKGKAFIYGFSSGISSQCSEHLRMSINLNYTYGRIKTDSSDFPLDHIPPIVGRFQLHYEYNKFSSDFFINYNGWKKMKDYYPNGEDNEQYVTPTGCRHGTHLISMQVIKYIDCWLCKPVSTIFWYTIQNICQRYQWPRVENPVPFIAFPLLRKASGFWRAGEFYRPAFLLTFMTMPLFNMAIIYVDHETTFRYIWNLMIVSSFPALSDFLLWTKTNSKIRAFLYYSDWLCI